MNTEQEEQEQSEVIIACTVTFYHHPVDPKQEDYVWRITNYESIDLAHKLLTKYGYRQMPYGHIEDNTGKEIWQLGEVHTDDPILQTDRYYSQADITPLIIQRYVTI